MLASLRALVRLGVHRLICFGGSARSRHVIALSVNSTAPQRHVPLCGSPRVNSVSVGTLVVDPAFPEPPQRVVVAEHLLRGMHDWLTIPIGVTARRETHGVSPDFVTAPARVDQHSRRAHCVHELCLAFGGDCDGLHLTAQYIVRCLSQSGLLGSGLLPVADSTA